MKICAAFNIASHYRANIYHSIAESYDCDFVFSKGDGLLKKMDYSLLNGKVKEVPAMTFLKLSWQIGVPLLAFKKYDRYIVMGDPRYLSTWTLLFFVKLFPKKKILLWTHGCYGRENLMKRIIGRCFFGMADAVLLYGNYAKGIMTDYGYRPDKLFVVHNSLDYDRQLELRNSELKSAIFEKRFNNNLRTVLFIGRLTSVKKLDMLVDALWISVQRGFAYNLVFVGDGQEKESLKLKVHSLGIDDMVWFFGACYDEKTNAELIYNADLCVAPGNIGLTAIHSLMYGTPAVSHNDFTMQMPEFEAITPTKTGDFFTFQDVNSLADTIEEWFHAHQDHRDIIRQNCYDEIDKFWTPAYQMNVIKNALEYADTSSN